jgi:signal transduction histidine kinase/ActR/RegA family two-component response regulator
MMGMYSFPPKTYFEIASFFYLLILYLISFQDPGRYVRSSKLFRMLELNMLLALVASILTYTFAIPEYGTPLAVCMLLRTLDSVLSVTSSRSFTLYLHSYVDTSRRLERLTVVGNVLFYVYLALMLLNIPLKFVLWYAPDGTYMHGTLFVPIVFTPPIYFMAINVLILVLQLKSMGIREKVSLSVASFITLLGLIVQAATDGKLLLSLPFGSVGIFVLYFSLETADYHRLLEKNEMLRIAEQDAVKANRAKSDFLASMSHEIRTPLNAVLGMDEMILRETSADRNIDSVSAGRIRSYAENIRDAGHILLSVINDILDLSKIESGKMEIKPAPYRLRALLGDVSTMIRVRAEQKGLVYTQTLDPDLPDALIGDELRIRQILINLLNNAVKYTDQGEVRLEVSRKGQSAQTLTLSFCVRDTGIGIKKENLPLIFGDFQRIDEEHNHRIEGTGLGLSIVKRLVGLMNGDISVSSEYEKGSVFTVYLPQEICDTVPGTDASAEEAAPDLPEERAFHTPDCTYLLVDDNRMNLLVAKHFLDELGGRIDTAASGNEALEKMRTATYDLIFMDHMMPDLDGIQTFELSLTDPGNINRDTPMIMMTANALSGMREEYLSKGFADYLSKPLDSKELLRVIRRHLPSEKMEPAN